MADHNDLTASETVEELNRVKNLPNKYGTDSQIDAEFRLNLDVTNLKNVIDELTEQEIELEPKLISGRKNPDLDTTRLLIYKLSEVMSDYEELSLPIRQSKNDLLAEETLNIANQLELTFSVKLFNAVIAIIPSRKTTAKHKNSGPIHQASRRFYVFLDSNGITKVESTTISHEAGSCYEINNLKESYSYNNSDYESAILILDTVPQSNLEYFLSDPRLASSKTYQNSEFFKGIVRDY